MLPLEWLYFILFQGGLKMQIEPESILNMSERIQGGVIYAD